MASYTDFVPLFKALADDTRLRIVDMLSCGEMCACKILESFQITQSTLSYHMKILTDCGLVTGRRDGAWIRYTVNQEKKDEILNFIQFITQAKDQCICEVNDGQSCAC